MDPGLMAPVTPPDVAIAVDDSPRHLATTRSHGLKEMNLKPNVPRLKNRKSRGSMPSLQSMPA